MNRSTTMQGKQSGSGHDGPDNWHRFTPPKELMEPKESVPEPRSQEPDDTAEFLYSSADRLANDDKIEWVVSEIVQAEIKAVHLLVEANLYRLTQLMDSSKPITEQTPLVEILVAIQVCLAGRRRDDALSWLESRKLQEGYRRDAVWEALTWLTASSEQHRNGTVIRQATSRAFLHDELVRNMIQPAEKSIEVLKRILKSEGHFYELALARRDEYLAKQQKGNQKSGWRQSSNTNGRRNYQRR